jgi:protein O-GlcNAc transferase
VSDVDQTAQRLSEVKNALLIGEWGGAQCAAASVLAAEPDNFEAWHLLGLAFSGAGAFERAFTCLQRATAAQPHQITWRMNLGELCCATGDWRRGADVFSEIIQMQPLYSAALTAYAEAMLKLKDYAESIRMFQQAHEIQPEAWEPIRGLASALIADQKSADAIRSIESFLHSHPAHFAAHRVLAEILILRGDYAAARDSLESLDIIDPTDDVRETLARLCWELGIVDAVLDYARPRGKESERSVALESFYTFLHLYQPHQDGYSLKAVCERSASRFPTCGPPRRFQPVSRNPERQLRIGYLSGDFMAGSPFFFLSSLIGNHSREEFEVFCYHTGPEFDQATKWFRNHSSWRDCRGLSNDMIDEQIRTDEIDILVDLSGLFPGHRLQIFGLRAAPVQVTYPNCPSTTGLKSIDYILTDRWTCPSGCEGWYTEQAVLLPGGYLAYNPPEDSPTVGSLPALQNGFVTFGLFQQLTKLNPLVLDAIADILTRVPKSRLLIFNSSRIFSNPSAHPVLRVRQELESRGVEPERIALEGHRSHLESLRLIGQVDIALDSFPYQGQTTTCESLWMGVPVVARSGLSHVARVGTAILERAGLGCLVANSSEDYVRLAVELAAQWDRLAELRSGMRLRLHQSSLLDGRRLAREVEDSYQWMWGVFCSEGRA